MKLNLYMVANKLDSMNPMLHIFETNKQVYRSCRDRLQADYLYIKEETDGVYIYGQYPDSYIFIKDFDIRTVYSTVLDIFDYYNENIERIVESLEIGDYQCVIDVCYDLFMAPCFILSRSNKVIAISSKPKSNELNNPEWRHLHEYGYSSLSNFNRFKDALRAQERLTDCRAVYYKSPPTSDRIGFSISMLCYENKIYGRITVMEYFRKFNEGDFYLLEFISMIISKHMHIAQNMHRANTSGDILIDLILKNKVESSDIENVMKYYGWSEKDTFRVIVISGKLNDDELKLAKEYFDNSFGDSLSTIDDDKIIILFSERKRKINSMIEMLKDSYLNKLNLKYGISLEFDNIKDIYFYYRQSVYTLDKNISSRLDEKNCFFYNYALDFILSNKDLDEKKAALNPDVVMYIRKFGKVECEALNTLYTYLILERSLMKAAEVLCIHRNTLLYRINKMTDEMSCDINDPYTREYILVSISFLMSL